MKIFSIAMSILLFASTANAGWFSEDNPKGNTDGKVMDVYNIHDYPIDTIRICRKVDDSNIGYQFMLTYSRTNGNINIVQIFEDGYHNNPKPVKCNLD